MKTSLLLRLSAISLTLLFFSGCKSSETPGKKDKLVVENFESVIKPIKDLEIAPRVFEVSASEASVIELPNGGSIEFPANAFVDKQGNPVSGKVKIEWQEFHSLTDIALSGIPMKYDSAGVENDLVSGGMFSIKGKAKGKEVDLAAGKTATVNIASIQDTPCFNFYGLDEKTGKWDYQTTKAGEKNPGAPQTEAVQAKTAKVTEPKEHIFDAAVNTSAFPELKNKQIVGWKTADPVGNTKFYGKTVTDCKLLPGTNKGKYVLSLSIGKETEEYDVTPYFFDQARKDSKKLERSINEDFSKIVAFQDNNVQGNTIRSIEIPGFGTYNWDCIMPRPGRTALTANFVLPNDENTQHAHLFLVSPSENLIISCSNNGVFSFNPRAKNALIAIMPDNTLAVLNDKGFDGARKLRNGDSHSFKLIQTGIKLTSGKDLANHLDEIFL